MYDLVLRGGTLVTPGDAFFAEIGILGGKISAIGHNLAGDRTLDATGLLVVPGAVDPHVHLQTPVGATQTSADYTPYAGLTLQGYPRWTMVRGQMLCAEGNYLGPEGGGQFLKRRHGH